MFQQPRIIKIVTCLAALSSISGCADVNRLGTKMDLAVKHIDQPAKKPLYEGCLQSATSIGSMTALQFTDGQFFDAREAPAALKPGDVVRVYKTSDGYEAVLWHAVKDADMTFALPTKAATVGSGS